MFRPPNYWLTLVRVKTQTEALRHLDHFTKPEWGEPSRYRLGKARVWQHCRATRAANLSAFSQRSRYSVNGGGPHQSCGTHDFPRQIVTVARIIDSTYYPGGSPLAEGIPHDD